MNNFMSTAKNITATKNNGINFLMDYAGKKLTLLDKPENIQEFGQPVYFDEKTKFIMQINQSPLGVGYRMYDFKENLVLDNYWYQNPTEEQKDTSNTEPSTLTPADAKLVKASYGFDWGSAPLFLNTLSAIRKNEQSIYDIANQILDKEKLVEVTPAPHAERRLETKGFVTAGEHNKVFLRTLVRNKTETTERSASLIMIDLKTGQYLNAFELPGGYRNAHLDDSQKHKQSILDQWTLV